MSTINDLLPELLAMILSDETLSLQQRITLRAVSKYWQAILEMNVLNLTKQLALGDSELHSLPFTTQSIPLLTQLFPLVADLTIALKSSRRSPYEELPQFLANFSSTLKTLKLLNIDRSQLENEIWTNYFTRTINSLTELTSFTLNFDNATNISAILPQLRPTLIRLQKLVYTAEDGLRQPHRFWQSFINTPLIRMIDLEIGQVVTPDYTAAVADIVATFPSLQRLSFIAQSERIDVTEMLRHLSSLQHLTELYLSAPYRRATQLSLPSETDRRLLNVKRLNWDIQFEPLSTLEDDHNWAALAAWFSSVEQLTVEGTKVVLERKLLITNSMLRRFSSLVHLTELSLSQVDFTSHLTSPKPTDRLFSHLKKFKVLFSYPFGQPEVPRDFGIISHFTLWFPNLESLTVDFLDDEQFRDNHNPLFQLTSSLLRNLSSLERLTSLQLPKMLCTPYLEAPSPIYRPLTILKSLNLTITDEHSDGDLHLCSALAAWCPRLEELIVDLLDDHDEANEYDLNLWYFELTGNALRDLANLENLRKLELPKMIYKREHLEVDPLPTDQPLTCLKKLRLNAYGFSTELDGEHLIATLVAHCPGLEELIVGLLDDDDPSSCQFYLTTNLVRNLANLPYLSNLELPLMLYKRKQPLLEAPLPTDQPLTVLQCLSLNITNSPEEFNGEQCFSAIAGWFPRLEMLFFGEYQPKFYLTTSMLRTLGRLEHLNYLDLSPFFYSKQHLDVPLSTDQPLTNIKSISDLAIIEPPAEFDGEHFCTTIAAWFPHCERLTIDINIIYKKASQPYRDSIEMNRHHFGHLNHNWLDFSFWFEPPPYFSIPKGSESLALNIKQQQESI